MIRLPCLLACFSLLLLLSACGDPSLRGEWKERDIAAFNYEEAVGPLEEEPPDITDFSFDPAYEYYPNLLLDQDHLLCLKHEVSTPTPSFLTVVDRSGRETNLLGMFPDFLLSKRDSASVPGLEFEAGHLLATGTEGSVALAAYYEQVLPYGLVLARWDREAETLKEVYRFQDGSVLGFLHFFSPDGRKAAFTWRPEHPGSDWHLTIVDMNSGERRDLTPPQWDEEPEFTMLFARWLDNETILVTESGGWTPDSPCVAWEYTLS